MRITSRIKRIEKKLYGNKEYWAVFTIGYYEDHSQREAAEKQLLDQYFASGNTRPTHCVFTNEIPAQVANQEEKFVYSFVR
jgi:hypothetical protein